MVKVSVIIPVRAINDYIRKCIEEINNQSFKDFEIIVITDQPSNEKFKKTKMMASFDKINPGDKRDIAAKKAKGKFIAFIDDDAYPDKDWLKNTLKNFEDPNIGAVGGPGLHPPEDSFMQLIGSKILESKLASGTEDYRCIIGQRKYVDDYPTFNLTVRKDVFDSVGGFNYDYYRGEDTKLCIEIIKTGKKIVYDPTSIVYHHRRALFKPHLRQMWQCSVYRGFFAKRFPQTSLRFAYFVPTLFVFGLVFGLILSFFNKYLAYAYIGVLALYVLLLIKESLAIKGIKAKLLLMIGIFITHVTYGIGIIKGLLAKELQ